MAQQTILAPNLQSHEVEAANQAVCAVIFDMDGLLLNTEEIYTQVTAEICKRYGLEYTWKTKAKLMGLNQMAAALALISDTGLPMTPEEYLKERNAKQEDRFPLARPLPGVMKLVQHLKRNGVKIAVATSSHHDHFLLKSTHNQDLFTLFDVIVTGDDPSIKLGKPAPDLFREAARRLGVDPIVQSQQCLVFEDAPNGVVAGLAGNFKVIWIPDDGLERDAELERKATATLRSMLDFIPQNYGLPAYPK
jgi:HAD superfamily hydrolase (TIGR01509 family)